MLIGLGIVHIVLTLFAGPFLDGFTRKYIKANLAHSREGPLVGPWQTFVDLFKLLGKEDLFTAGGIISLQMLAPLVALSSALVASLMVPLSGIAPLGAQSDMIVFLYTIGLGAVAVVIGAMATGSPYAYAGSLREISLYLIVEPVLMLAMLGAMALSRSLHLEDQLRWHYAQGFSLPMLIGAVAVFVALQAQFGKLPFDIAEAEQEVISGPFIEISGPRLALLRWFFLSRQFVFAGLFCTVFLPWGLTAYPVVNLLITLVKIFVVYSLIGLIDAVMPRVRIDQALRVYFAVLIIALLGAVLAFVSA
ncbi:MAG: NADH-quinone oxidoreductase subunit H [Armatimonadetes bacterium]|nr:NADH-quinone oxidoreductase subunit H [Armatimonadota bacterium]MDW8122391.1 complex I subunit 1 family protein [Armatimonadota bacterium]